MFDTIHVAPLNVSSRFKIILKLINPIMSCLLANEEIMNLTELALEKIDFGKQLIEQLKSYAQLDGSKKLERKINQESTFLRKIYNSNRIKKEHLQCSNLTHFAALIKTLREVHNCISLVKSFNLNDRKIVVDIVCDNGLSWIKVIARNPKSIEQICLGETNYGVRSIIDQAEEFLECSKLYPCLFQTPKVTFVFTNGISNNLAGNLQMIGVTVKGNRLKDLNCEKINSELMDINTSNFSDVNRLNLDVSAMLAYCSSVTNGSCDKYEFQVPVLAKQAEWECLRPQKIILDELFKDKRLYCCQTARDNFVNILSTVGGPNERIRGEDFLKKLTVLPDDASFQDFNEHQEANTFNSVQFIGNKQLDVGGKIRERSLIIFRFGDRIRAMTVTANDGFVRAARQQGVNFVVFVHESRALTEQKELIKAKRIK